VKFVDEVIITVQSGNGGNGCVSFRREKFIPRGGPDGGNGGKGGDVIMISSPRKRTLYDFQYHSQLKAKNGSGGQGKNKTGRRGDDLSIEVPVGTLVRDADSGEILKDFITADDAFTIAKGGRGGLGNSHFKTSTNRTPRFAQPGEAGKSIHLKLELKLLADVGLIGLPNAGKSTLISKISRATPKIDAYPFTTLTPTLGVVYTQWDEPFIVADIPGLIEGAHEGAGLGIRFLRHIERTRILVHLIDVSTIQPEDVLFQYRTIMNEIEKYSKKLSGKSQLIVLNKIDIFGAEKKAALFRSAFEDKEVLTISALTKEGIDGLLSKIVERLKSAEEAAPNDIIHE
jgi:GTP-binding protein